MSRDKMAGRGALIVLEGCDRAGKSTQCKKLVQALIDSGRRAKLMAFPDRTTRIGQMIGEYLTCKSELEDHVIHLLFSANRWEAMPTLKETLLSGTTCIIDRYAFSGVAFTAAKQGFTLDWCKQPDKGLLRPDMVCFLDLPPSEALKRAEFGGERYENIDFQKKVLESYESLRDDNWKTVDASYDVETVHSQLLQLALEAIDASKGKPMHKLWTEENSKI